MMAQRGGWERLLAGPERLVYCVGRAETLLLPAVAVDHWDRDYSMESVNMVGDTTSNPRCVERREYIEAKRQGAAGIMIFTSPADNHGKAYMFKQGDG